MFFCQYCFWTQGSRASIRVPIVWSAFLKTCQSTLAVVLSGGDQLWRQCCMGGESERTKTYVLPGLHFPPQGPLRPFFIPDSFFYYPSEDSRSSMLHVFGVFLVPLAGSSSMWSQETVLLRIAAKSLQSCPTLCDPIDSSQPGSPVPGILQARTLEWVAISFSNAWKWKVKVKALSCIRLIATPWTAARQGPPSMGFSRQEYWSGVPLPSPLGIGLRLILSEPHLRLTQEALRTLGHPWWMCQLCPLGFHPCSGLQHPMAPTGPTHWRRQCCVAS